MNPSPTRLHRSDTRDPGSLRSNQLRDIFEDRDGNLWVGTVPDGVNLIDVNERRFTKHLAAATVDSSLPWMTLRPCTRIPPAWCGWAVRGLEYQSYLPCRGAVLR